jgi:Ni,Fe-hydrogenase III small subunit
MGTHSPKGGLGCVVLVGLCPLFGGLTIAAEDDIGHKEKNKPSQIQDPYCPPDPWTVMIIARNTPACTQTQLAIARSCASRPGTRQKGDSYSLGQRHGMPSQNSHVA